MGDSKSQVLFGCWSRHDNDRVYEGITENVETWRTDVVAKIIGQLGLEKVMFEAADPKVFEWYIKNYGNRVSVPFG